MAKDVRADVKRIAVEIPRGIDRTTVNYRIGGDKEGSILRAATNLFPFDFGQISPIFDILSVYTPGPNETIERGFYYGNDVLLVIKDTTDPSVTKYRLRVLVFDSAGNVSSSFNLNSNPEYSYPAGSEPSFPDMFGIQGWILSRFLGVDNIAPDAVSTASGGTARNGNDNNLRTDWVITATSPPWEWKVQFSTQRIVYRYAISATADLNTVGRTPVSWTFEGSNDSANWEILDTQSISTPWMPEETRMFTIPNERAFTYYRFNISASSVANEVAVAEFALNERLASRNAGSFYFCIKGTPILRIEKDDAGNYSTQTIGVNPSGRVSGGTLTVSGEDPSFLGARAIDGKYAVSSDCWRMPTGAGVAWLRYDYGAGRELAISEYRIVGFEAASSSASPKDWTLYGSNAVTPSSLDTPGTDWDVIHQVAGQTSWGDFEPRRFRVVNTKKYRWYGLKITANNGNASFAGLAEFELFPTFIGNGPMAIFSDRLMAVSANNPTLLQSAGPGDDNLIGQDSSSFHFPTGGPITQISTYGFNSSTQGPLTWLLVFKQSSLHVLTGADITVDRKEELTGAIGTLSPHSVVSVPEGVVYVGTSIDGSSSVYILDNLLKNVELGFEIKADLSKIPLEKLKNIVAAYTGNRIYRLFAEGSEYFMDLIAGYERKAWFGPHDRMSSLESIINLTRIGDVSSGPPPAVLYVTSSDLYREESIKTDKDCVIQTKLFDAGFLEMGLYQIIFTAYSPSKNVFVRGEVYDVKDNVKEVGTIEVGEDVQQFYLRFPPLDTKIGKLSGVRIVFPGTGNTRLINMLFDYIVSGKPV